MGLFDQVIGGVTGSQGESSSTSPLVKALLLLLAAKAFTSYTDRPKASQAPRAPDNTSSDTIQSGILKGAPSLSGLSTLLKRLTNGGLGGPVKSWVGPGPNEPVPPDQLQKALGPEVIDKLQQQTGMPRDQLMAELSRILPQVVDKLTPEGRMPTTKEAAHW
jgi:uncharacterized protein YidB (DUF937 family)